MDVRWFKSRFDLIAVSKWANLFLICWYFSTVYNRGPSSSRCLSHLCIFLCRRQLESQWCCSYALPHGALFQLSGPKLRLSILYKCHVAITTCTLFHFSISLISVCKCHSLYTDILKNKNRIE